MTSRSVRTLVLHILVFLAATMLVSGWPRIKGVERTVDGFDLSMLIGGTKMSLSTIAINKESPIVWVGARRIYCVPGFKGLSAGQPPIPPPPNEMGVNLIRLAASAILVVHVSALIRWAFQFRKLRRGFDVLSTP
jgi:hypothetical protein